MLAPAFDSRALRPRWPRLILARVLIVLLLLLPVHAGATPTLYDWLQFDGDAQHSGNNTHETIISTSNVAALHLLYQMTLPGATFASNEPVYLSAVSTPSGVRNLLFVTTFDAHLLAIDAQTHVTVWSHSHSTTQLCPAPYWHPKPNPQPCYTYASPAIDPNRQFVYSYGLDGKVHKFAVSTGTESFGGGWPQLVTRKPLAEKASSNLTVATAADGTTYLYITTSSYEDLGDYQGHLTTITLNTGTQHVFNALCSNQVNVHFGTGSSDCIQATQVVTQAGIWSRGSVAYDAATERIYTVVGNGIFVPTTFDWADSVLALNSNGTGVAANPLDSYTPRNYAQLQAQDLDLGSTGPAILTVPATSTVQHLAVQGGKDGLLRLLNLDNLSGQGGPGHLGGEIGPLISVPQGGEVLAQPAVWVNPADGSTWVFVATSVGLSGLRLTLNSSGTPSLHEVWKIATGSTSPLVANGVLYMARSNLIQALSPTTGQVLWHDTRIGTIHWQSPIVDNGVLYILDNNGHLTAYS